ncbi:MAG TPA: DUF427 domain-containing protein, partial [Aldersonia sp.]
MATSMAHVFGMLGELRYQECEKRVRVTLGEMLVADTGHPVLIWEPKRVVPSYAIPIDDIRAELQPMAGATDATAQPFAVEGLGAGLLDPRTSFGHHTCPGDVYSVAGTPGVGFRPAELVDLMVLDFDTFDWREEDEPIFGHPRDPFSRIDLRQSTRHVRVESGGRVLAESSRPLMLFETYLPPRYYLPRADLQIDLVQSETSTVCAYKGSATHWSHPELGADLCWSYPHPPPEMHQITDLVCFYQE